MGISPTYIGYLAPKWTIQLVPDSGVVDISGLATNNFTLLLRNKETGAKATGAGTFSNITASATNTVNDITTITPASVQYQLVSADLVIGRYDVWVTVTFSNGTQPFYMGIWEVLAAI